MTLTLNHFSIRTSDLDASRRFYGEVLGFTVGPRPAFPFPGVWMYRGDHADVANAVVHLIGIEAAASSGLNQYLGDRGGAVPIGSGAVDHIAFFADGLAPMLAHFQALSVKVRERTVPSIGLHQVFLDDPSGVVIELNFAATEQAGLGDRDMEHT